MSKDNNKNIICCFTGHRPEKLGMPEREVIEWLEKEIRSAVENKYTTFISGMQKGVDIWAAEIVLKLKAEGLPVKLIAASAFKGMEDKMSKDWKSRYIQIIEAADEVHYISNTPGKDVYLKRDYWMVNNASMIIGVFTGAPGGTKKTIAYAKSRGLKIVVTGQS